MNDSMCSCKWSERECCCCGDTEFTIEEINNKCPIHGITYGDRKKLV